MHPTVLLCALTSVCVCVCVCECVCGGGGGLAYVRSCAHIHQWNVKRERRGFSSRLSSPPLGCFLFSLRCAVAQACLYKLFTGLSTPQSHPDETKPTSFDCFENDSLYCVWFRQIQHEGNKGSLTFRVISQEHRFVSAKLFLCALKPLSSTGLLKSPDNVNERCNSTSLFPPFFPFDLLKSTIIFSHSSPPLHCVWLCVAPEWR